LVEKQHDLHKVLVQGSLVFFTNVKTRTGKKIERLCVFPE
jgi:hypothetical protein